VSDQCVQPRYHGLDAFCDDGPVDYLRTMLAAEPFTYRVRSARRVLVESSPPPTCARVTRYLVGTPDMSLPASAPDGVAAMARGAGDLWGANPAAVSRRRNPYLARSKRYIEYDEAIEPERIAACVMRTREQLATEWAADLAALAGGPPAHDGGDSSPTRAANADLCARLATRAAALAAIHELSPADGRFLKAALAPEVADAAAADADADAADAAAGDDIHRELCRLNRGAFRDALGDHCATLGKAEAWLAGLDATVPFASGAGSPVDPPRIAAAVREFRAPLCADWAESIVDAVATEHWALKRDVLETQLAAP